MGSVEIDVLLAGQTGVGKSSIANMIMGKPDGSPDAAGVSGDARPCTTETTSYIAHLDGNQYRLWDTRGLDEAVDTPGILPKLLERFRQPDRELKATCRKRTKQAAPILIWCILASKIDVPVHWEQFRKVYEDYCGKKVKPVVVLTKMTAKSSSEWESRCKAQLQRLGPGVGHDDVRLFRVREYRRVPAPEYAEDSQRLNELVSQVSRHGD